jgi:hypothetical protein
VFGNRTPITASSFSDGGAVSPVEHRVGLSDAPLFLENVDARLAQFMASFRVDPAMLQTAQVEHKVKLHLVNPWPVRVDGRITILEPGRLSTADPTQRDRSWKIHPRTSSFSIAAGQELELPLVVTFSGAEEMGVKQLVAEVELSSRPPPAEGQQGPGGAGRAKDWPPLRLATPLELSTDSIQMDLSYRYDESRSIIVVAQVSNKGRHGSTLELVASAPGLPRVKASISDLEPGGWVMRRFSFPEAPQLRGQTVTVGVQDIRTGARLTGSIQIE